MILVLERKTLPRKIFWPPLAPNLCSGEKIYVSALSDPWLLVSSKDQVMNSVVRVWRKHSFRSG